MTADGVEVVDGGDVGGCVVWRREGSTRRSGSLRAPRGIKFILVTGTIEPENALVRGTANHVFLVALPHAKTVNQCKLLLELLRNTTAHI